MTFSYPIYICLSFVFINIIHAQVINITCTTTFESVRNNSFTALCPSGCTAQAVANVYGSSPYAGGSSVCRAAIHASNITDAGGYVTVEPTIVPASFAGTIANGITSSPSISAPTAFVFRNEVNECEEESDNCHSNASCSNTNGSFTCTCNPGYTGSGVVCDDIDECVLGLHNCSQSSDCVNTDGSFTCSCKSGYTGNGSVCTDVNECEENSDNCHFNAICLNSIGSFVCSCHPGYTGSGVVCDDTDECVLGLHTCSQSSDCVNTDGSFTCSCKSGFTGNGSVCADIDECIASDNRCSQLETCENNPGSYACICISGFQANGSICVDIDECASFPCLPIETCINCLGSYFCFQTGGGLCKFHPSLTSVLFMLVSCFYLTSCLSFVDF